MPGAIYRLKKNKAEKISGAKNTAILLIWMPAVPVPCKERTAAAVFTPCYRSICLFDLLKKIFQTKVI